MRKRYKLKKRSCPMCKPNKMRWEHCRKPSEIQQLELAEKEIKNSLTILQRLSDSELA